VSHFTTLHTQITDQDSLVAALSDIGFSEVEVHSEPQALQGYMGDRRRQRAHVIIRRQFVGSASNDIGFERQGDGNYRAWISEFDRGHGYNAEWVGRVTARHAYHVTQKTLVNQGFNVVQEQRAEDGSVRMILRRVT
jgi:Protein of unknown function (DUF1257)